MFAQLSGCVVMVILLVVLRPEPGPAPVSVYRQRAEGSGLRARALATLARLAIPTAAGELEPAGVPLGRADYSADVALNRVCHVSVSLLALAVLPVAMSTVHGP